MFLDWLPELKQLTLQGTLDETTSGSGGELPPFTIHSTANWSYSFERATMTKLNKYPYCLAYGGLDYWNGGIPFSGTLPFPFTFLLWCDQMAPLQGKTYRGSAYYVSGVGVAIPPDYHPQIGVTTFTGGDDPPDPAPVYFSKVSFTVSTVKADMGLYCTNNNSGYNLHPGACLNREQPHGSVRRTPYQDPIDWFGPGNAGQLSPPEAQDYVATRIQYPSEDNDFTDIQLITLQPNYFPNDQVSYGSFEWPDEYTAPKLFTAETSSGQGAKGFVSNPQDFGDEGRLMLHYPINVNKIWIGLLGFTEFQAPDGRPYVVCKSPQEVLVFHYGENPPELIQGRSILVEPPPLIAAENRHPQDTWRRDSQFYPPGSRPAWSDPPYTSGIGFLEINSGSWKGQGYMDLESGDPSFSSTDTGSHTSEPDPETGQVTTTSWSYYVAATFS